MNKIIKDIKEALNTDNKTKAYDTQAKVIRSEGQTLWVHIPGGVDETPVKKTINAKAGDTVQVRVGGGSAWIVGNQSAPPTDDTKAEEAKQEIVNTNIIVKAVKTIAEQAQKIAGNTNQYFWHTESGTDTGAHITEIPQEDFIDDPQNGGGNLLARSNGIAVRDGLTELATFGASGSRIGEDNESHLMQDYHSFEMIDRNRNTYFAVGDLRGRNGKFTQTDTFIGDGSTHQFSPTFYIDDDLENTMVVKVNNVTQVLGTDYDFEYKEIWINTAPANGATITLTYEARDQEAKYYTFGTRKTGSNSGAMSIVGNKNNVASGAYCAAFGEDNVASGYRSIALGHGTIANGLDQLVLGSFNNTGQQYERLAFIIGNGGYNGDTIERSNALTIDHYGKIVTAQMQSGTINSVSVPANSYKDVSVTFSKQMSGIPTVVCTVYSVSTAGAIGNINAAVTYTTSRGFTCRIFNAGSTAREPAVNWIAMNV